MTWPAEQPLPEKVQQPREPGLHQVRLTGKPVWPHGL